MVFDFKTKLQGTYNLREKGVAKWTLLNLLVGQGLQQRGLR